MITANNGILIVVMLFAWALKVGDHTALWSTVTAAMLSYIANAADEYDAKVFRWVNAVAAVVFVLFAFGRLSSGA